MKIDQKNIPAEVVEAAARVLHANAEVFHDVLWDDLGDYDQGAYRDEARAAIAAGLAAWPGVQHITGQEGSVSQDGEHECLILSIAQEGGK